MYVTFTREGVDEKVQVEKWGWGVIYKDGSELHQFDLTNGKFHQFQEIDVNNVDLFVMYETSPESNKRFDIVVTEDMQIFHFYRTVILSAGSPDEQRFKSFVFGWKNRNSGGMSYNYILPNGRVISANHDIQAISNYL